MGIIRKQSTSSAILIYLGIVIGFVSAAVLRPKILSPEEIGFLQVVLNMSIFLGAVLTLGANLITIKMYPQFEQVDSNKKGLFRLIVYFGSLGAFLGIPILFLTESLFLENNQGERFEHLSYDLYFYVSIYLLIVLRTFSNLFDNYLRANHITVPGVFSESILLKTLPILILILFFFGVFNYQQLFYSNLFIYVFPLIISLYFLKKIKAINWTKPGPFTKEEKREMWGISSVGFMEIISYFIVLFIDVFMLKRLMNDEAVGIYSTMFFFGTVVSIPLKAFIRIAHPIISAAFVKKDMSTISEIYKKSSNILFVLGGLVFLLVWGNRHSIEQFLDPAYAQGIWVIFFIGLAHLIDVVFSVNYQIISITPHYRFNLYMGALMVVLLIVTNYIFIELFGLVGVAVGSLVSMVLVNFTRHIFLVSKYKLSPFSINTIKIAALCIILFFVSEWIPIVDNLYWNAILKSSILALLYLPAAYLFKCSEDFNTVVNKYLNIIRSNSKK
jgi:O-antigen/teichoic acid export membrane protein